MNANPSVSHSLIHIIGHLLIPPVCCRSRSMSDASDLCNPIASGSIFNYYGSLHTLPVIAVAPQWTSQECSGCGTIVKKSLSVRTHICTRCGVVLDRDHNAALNILAKALERTVGHTGTAERDSANASGQTASTRRPKRATSKRAG